MLLKMCRCCPKWKTYSIPNPNSSSSPDGQQMPSFACIVRRRPNPKGSEEGRLTKKGQIWRAPNWHNTSSCRTRRCWICDRTMNKPDKDWGQRIQAWRDALRLDTFLGRFLLSFFYALLGPNGKHIYLPDCHWVVCWVHCVCRACACSCVCVCVLATQCKLLPDAGQTRPGSVSHGELLRVARWCFWSCPCPLEFERHSFKVP